MCFKFYTKNIAQTKQKLSIFIASDDEEVKQTVLKGIEHEVGIKAHILNDPYIHVTKQRELDNKHKTKVVKTFAELHIISRSQAVFLTQSSLFGRTAAEMGNVSEHRRYHISASDCDDPNRFGYITCHTPKYPSFCAN